MMGREINDFLSYVTVKKGLAENSIKHCRIRVGIFYKWLDENSKDINKQSVEEFVLYLKDVKRLRNNSLNTYLFALRMLRDYSKDRGFSYDFLDGFQSFKKDKPVIAILTPEEIDLLLKSEVRYGSNSHTPYDAERSKAANQRYGALTHFLAMTGCRLAEATNLKRKYIDFATGSVTFVETKNKEYRRVFIGQPLLGLLYDLTYEKNDNEYIFTNDMGKPIVPTNYQLYLQRLTKVTGIKKRVHPHIFRHSMATQLLMEGVDVSMVATILGHKDIQTTFSNYVHLADQTIRKAQLRHPLMRRGMKPQELIDYMKDVIENSMIKDERFDVRMETSGEGIRFQMVQRH
jgi:integrase/recombinase XerD